MNQDISEYLDLVDENDQVIGIIERNVAYARGIANFRVIDAFIKNDEGKLFVPRRHPAKRSWPSALDCSVGGHVTSGDSYDETLLKEAKEELNIDISELSYKKLGTLTPHEDGSHAFVTVYEISWNETPKYNPEDFVEHFWLTPEEILDRLETGDTAKSNLPRILKKFYL